MCIKFYRSKLQQLISYANTSCRYILSGTVFSAELRIFYNSVISIKYYHVNSMRVFSCYSDECREIEG